MKYPTEYSCGVSRGRVSNQWGYPVKLWYSCYYLLKLRDSVHKCFNGWWKASSYLNIVTKSLVNNISNPFLPKGLYYPWKTIGTENDETCKILMCFTNSVLLLFPECKDVKSQRGQLHKFIDIFILVITVVTDSFNINPIYMRILNLSMPADSSTNIKTRWGIPIDRLPCPCLFHHYAQ